MSTQHYLRGSISTDVLPWKNSAEGLKEGHRLFHTSMAALVELQLEFGDEDREFGRICDTTLCHLQTLWPRSICHCFVKQNL